MNTSVSRSGTSNISFLIFPKHAIRDRCGLVVHGYEVWAAQETAAQTMLARACFRNAAVCQYREGVCGTVKAERCVDGDSGKNAVPPLVNAIRNNWRNMPSREGWSPMYVQCRVDEYWRIFGGCGILLFHTLGWVHDLWRSIDVRETSRDGDNRIESRTTCATYWRARYPIRSDTFRNWTRSNSEGRCRTTDRARVSTIISSKRGTASSCVCIRPIREEV